MAQKELEGMRIAILATDGFEEVELTEPKKALEKAGAEVDVISDHQGEIQGFKHHDKAGKVRVNRTLDEAGPNEYSGFMLPGGALNADQARMNEKIRYFIREMDRARKPIAAICHAPWELISADVVRGRKLTSWATIQDDIRNAGGLWENRDAVIDQNWLTSRGPHDLPSFNREMIGLFSRVPAESQR